MLGEILRTERERQRLTIQDIEEGTSIRAVYIEAIETGDYKRLPGDVYTKGFIKSYASFLNLNGDELVKQFIAEKNPEMVVAETVAENVVVEPEENVSRIKITDLPETKMKLPKKKLTDDEPSSRSSSGSGFKFVAAVVLLAVIAAGAWAYLSGVGAEISDVDTNQRQNQPAVVADNQKDNNPTSPTDINSATNTAQAAIPQTGINIQAKFSGDCWTQVIADGMLVYEDTATSGQVLNWAGKENVIVRVGNAGVVELENNGQNLGTLGTYGEVTEKTFTAPSRN